MAKAIGQLICEANGKSHWSIELQSKWQKPSVDGVAK